MTDTAQRAIDYLQQWGGSFDDDTRELLQGYSLEIVQYDDPIAFCYGCIESGNRCIAVLFDPQGKWSVIVKDEQGGAILDELDNLTPEEPDLLWDSCYPSGHPN